MKKFIKFKFLFISILACFSFVGMEGCEGCATTQVQPSQQRRGMVPTTVQRMDVYTRPSLFVKEFTVVGIVSIRPERPTEMTSSRGINELVSPINLRLMEEARRLGAHDIIEVRVDRLPDGSWVSATALAIRYERGFFPGNVRIDP
jgi:hypothetical protein